MMTRRAMASAVCACLLACPALAGEDQTVLVLHSYHHGFTWTDKISEGIDSAFESRRHGVEILYEFLDSRRLSTTDHFKTVQAFLKQKYADRKMDVTHEKMLQNEIRQSHKMAAIGQIAHRITHRFTNMLVVILGNAQLARERVTDMPDVASQLDEIIKAGNDVTSFSAELLAFAHPSPLKTKKLPVHRIVLGIEQVLRKTTSGVAPLELEVDKKVGKVSVDPTQMEQVILHLLINATDAVSSADPIVVKVAPADLSPRDLLALQAGMPEDRRHEGGFGMIAVIDEGRGMTAEERARMFEPFFSTKEDDPQAGLGLATAHRIVSQHGGHILVESRPGSGTTVRVILPLVD